jgi:hypothetical protein
MNGIYGLLNWLSVLITGEEITCPIDEKPCAKSKDCCFWPDGCSEAKG